MKFKMSSTNFKLEDFSWIFSQQLLQNGAAAVFCALLLAGMCELDTIGIAQRIPCKTMIHKLADNFAGVFLWSAAKLLY